MKWFGVLASLISICRALVNAQTSLPYKVQTVVTLCISTEITQAQAEAGVQSAFNLSDAQEYKPPEGSVTLATSIADCEQAGNAAPVVQAWNVQVGCPATSTATSAMVCSGVVENMIPPTSTAFTESFLKGAGVPSGSTVFLTKVGFTVSLTSATSADQVDTAGGTTTVVTTEDKQYLPLWIYFLWGGFILICCAVPLGMFWWDKSQRASVLNAAAGSTSPVKPQHPPSKTLVDGMDGFSSRAPMDGSSSTSTNSRWRLPHFLGGQTQRAAFVAPNGTEFAPAPARRPSFRRRGSSARGNHADTASEGGSETSDQNALEDLSAPQQWLWNSGSGASVPRRGNSSTDSIVSSARALGRIPAEDDVEIGQFNSSSSSTTLAAALAEVDTSYAQGLQEREAPRPPTVVLNVESRSEPFTLAAALSELDSAEMRVAAAQTS